MSTLPIVLAIVAHTLFVYPKSTNEDKVCGVVWFLVAMFIAALTDSPS